MALLGLESMIQRSSKLLSTSFPGETVMMDMEQGKYFGLDLVGTEIWNRMESPIRIRELISQLMSIYQVDESVISADVLEFVGVMVDKNLVNILSTEN